LRIKILNIHLLYFLLFSNIVFSQNFVDEFIEHYNGFDDYLLEFEYISKNNDEIIFKNEGVIMSQKNKFRILIDKVIFIYDGKKYYNIINENKEVNISKTNELSNYLIPTNLSKYISNNRDKIKVVMNTDIKILYTDDSNNNFIIVIDKNYNIIRIDQLLTNTYTNSIFFKKTLFNQNLSDSLFKFKKMDFKDYYINEL
tara:strand:+ start:1627 stop:2223 length:597 start_codon:yes stop_codon:yes gene_type:complete